MKKIPNNKYTDRLNAIYEDLNLAIDDRFWADIVVSNFLDMSGDDTENIFVCEYGFSNFYEMMDRLSQSDVFVDLMKENDVLQMFNMLELLLSPQNGIKHDLLGDMYSVITHKTDPIIASDVSLVRDIDVKIEEKGIKEIWYKYLKRIELYSAYKSILNLKL